jgi:hypothetical protein
MRVATSDARGLPTRFARLLRLAHHLRAGEGVKRRKPIDPRGHAEKIGSPPVLIACKNCRATRLRNQKWGESCQFSVAANGGPNERQAATG